MRIVDKKGKKDKKKKKKKKIADKPLEDMTREEQDEVIEDLLADDSINKKTVNPIRPGSKADPTLSENAPAENAPKTADDNDDGVEEIVADIDDDEAENESQKRDEL